MLHLKPKIRQKLFVGRAVRGPAGEFTALPQISYVHFGEGEGGGEGKEGDEGEGDGREGKGRPRKG